MTETEILKFPLGSEKNPVRADGPPGQRAYIERLQCKDKGRPLYRRIGSVGFGPWGNIMDLYRLQCPNGDVIKIYMDHYHPSYNEMCPVPGFEISE